MTKEEIDELDGIRKRVTTGVFQIVYQTWNRHNPQPMHETLGAALTPELLLMERVTDDQGEDSSNVYVQQATFHAHASWEAPTSEENTKGLEFAGYIARLLNAAPKLIAAARKVMEEERP